MGTEWSRTTKPAPGHPRWPSAHDLSGLGDACSARSTIFIDSPPVVAGSAVELVCAVDRPPDAPRRARDDVVVTRHSRTVRTRSLFLPRRLVSVAEVLDVFSGRAPPRLTITEPRTASATAIGRSDDEIYRTRVTPVRSSVVKAARARRGPGSACEARER